MPRHLITTTCPFKSVPELILPSCSRPVNLVPQDDNRTVRQLFICQKRIQLNLNIGHFVIHEFEHFSINHLFSVQQIIGSTVHLLQFIGSIHQLFNSFIQSLLLIISSSPLFTNPLTHSLIHLFIHSSTYSSSHPLIHSLIHLFIHSSTYSSSHPPIHSLIHLFILSSTYSFTHPLIHPLIHLFILSSTYLFTHQFRGRKNEQRELYFNWKFPPPPLRYF